MILQVAPSLAALSSGESSAVVVAVKLVALRVAPLLPVRGLSRRCWRCGNCNSRVLENF